MRNIMLRLILAPMLVVAGMLVTGTALAEKPSHAGGGKESKQAQRDERGGSGARGGPAATQRGHDRRPAQASEPSAGGHFNEHHRVAVQSYYDEQFHRGSCPPGLAKKNNGCMPPGQAKRWTVGRTLPGDVVFHDLPPELVTVLGAPPAGHRYVRVARDILLITSGTAMVVAGLDGLLGN